MTNTSSSIKVKSSQDENDFLHQLHVITEKILGVRRETRIGLTETITIKTIFETFRKLETKVLCYISQISFFRKQDEAYFDLIAGKRREFNKRANFEEGVQLQKSSKSIKITYIKLRTC